MLRQTAEMDVSELREFPQDNRYTPGCFLGCFEGIINQGRDTAVRQRRRENGGKMSTMYHCTVATAERGGRS